MPLTTKVFNRKKWLILGSFRMYPFKLHSNGVLAICPKNKPFLAETLKAEKAVAEPPKNEIGVAEALAFDLPSHVCSPIISDI
jgi:hypothetical protein